MNVAFPEFRMIRFPGEAGRLQETGMTASLVRELGDEYPRYHAFLAERLRSLGAIPRIEDYENSQDFLDAWQLIHEVLMAETTIRGCRAHRVEGEPLRFGWDGKVPLIGEDYSLVGVP